MKHFTFIALAAFAMVSCGNTYKAQRVQLANQNDSMNYALGYVQGAQLKMQQLHNDSSEQAVTEFMDALQRGYDNQVPKLEEHQQAGKSIGQGLKMAEERGLADQPAWTINQKIFFQGLINAIHQDTVMMQAAEARDFFQHAYMMQSSNSQDEKAGKPVTAKCVDKVKNIPLNSFLDSLNYAFGVLNGDEIYRYMLSSDSDGVKAKEFVEQINRSLGDKTRYPQLVNYGERIGQAIREQEPEGLINEPSLTTDFELIKQGFVNGLKNYDELMDFQQADLYIQETLNHIKYGDTKSLGEQFLRENAQKPGVKVTESGLQYLVLKEGKGRKPAATDRVKVHYHGTLINGEVFDSSVERGDPITFGLNQVIKGWTEGVQLMPIGSKFRFFIPQELGYGAQAAGSIPPYSTLIFDVELLNIE